MKLIVSSEIIVIENVGKPAGDAELGARAARNAASLRVPIRLYESTDTRYAELASEHGWAGRRQALRADRVMRAGDLFGSGLVLLSVSFSDHA